MKISDFTLDLRSYNTETCSHHHDYHQLVLPVSGKLAMEVENHEGEVSLKQIAVIHAGQNHGFAASGKNRFIVTDIPQALAPGLEQWPTFITLDKTLGHYVSFLYQQLQSSQKNIHTERQMLLLLLQLLKERFGEAVKPDKRIELARSYLDQHYQQSISLARLALVANLSPRQLSELFRRILGMTPQQYQIEKRMQQAWSLLEQSELSIQRIAEITGYNSLAAFSDRFRKHFGHPPRYFRQISK
ncbi:MAG: helix-turn-helix domain-containing protein [Pontibacterium sp.]